MKIESEFQMLNQKLVTKFMKKQIILYKKIYKNVFAAKAHIIIVYILTGWASASAKTISPCEKTKDHSSVVIGNVGLVQKWSLEHLHMRTAGKK